MDSALALSTAKRNKFSFSVGLLVFDYKTRVYLIERLLPYSVESCLMKHGTFKDRVKYFRDKEKFGKEIKEICLNECDLKDEKDTINFINVLDGAHGTYFEDQLDFSHGQTRYFKSLLKDVNNKPNESCIIQRIKLYLRRLLKEAQREWNEETQKIILNWSVDSYLNGCDDLFCFLTEFEGCDGLLYTQLYFLVSLKHTQKVIDKVSACDPSTYVTHVVDFEYAVKMIQLQDKYCNKKSHKDSLLLCAHNILYSDNRYKQDNISCIHFEVEVR
jgi:hypothetical protein